MTLTLEVGSLVLCEIYLHAMVNDHIRYNEFVQPM